MYAQQPDSTNLKWGIVVCTNSTLKFAKRKSAEVEEHFRKKPIIVEYDNGDVKYYKIVAANFKYSSEAKDAFPIYQEIYNDAVIINFDIFCNELTSKGTHLLSCSK